MKLVNMSHLRRFVAPILFKDHILWAMDEKSPGNLRIIVYCILLNQGRARIRIINTYPYDSYKRIVRDYRDRYGLNPNGEHTEIQVLSEAVRDNYLISKQNDISYATGIADISRGMDFHPEEYPELFQLMGKVYTEKGVKVDWITDETF